MDGGDHSEADVGDVREADDGELVKALSQTPQLPPNFSVVYRCGVGAGDRHRRPPRKGYTVPLARRTSVTFARRTTVSLHVHKRHSFRPALARFRA